MARAFISVTVALSHPGRIPRGSIDAVMSVALTVAGVLVGLASVSPTVLWLKLGLFLVGAALVLGGLRRRPGAALVTIGVFALAHAAGRLDVVDGWTVVFVVSTAAGILIWLQRFAFRWTVASVPFWALGDAHDLFAIAAVGLTVAGLLVVAVGPTLPGRRVRRLGTPLPHLANGPLVPVTARTYYAGRRSRVLSWLTRLLGAGAVLFVVAAGLAQGPDTTTVAAALALACAIMAATMAFSNWFATRVRLRLDEVGLHTRTLVVERTIPWTDVAGLTLRYVYLAYGIRLVYFVAYSTTREFAFTSKMPGAADLQATIEAATGLDWPAPEFEGNF